MFCIYVLTFYINYKRDSTWKEVRARKPSSAFRELWLIIMLKPPLLSTVSYLPADYDNVVRLELRGKFSKGSARPRINMEELDWREAKKRICSLRPQLTRKRNAKPYRIRNVARQWERLCFWFHNKRTKDYVEKNQVKTIYLARLFLWERTLKYNTAQVYVSFFN